MRKIKVEWCENFIKKTFAKLPAFATGIEIGCFWNMAEKSSTNFYFYLPASALHIFPIQTFLCVCAIFILCVRKTCLCVRYACILNNMRVPMRESKYYAELSIAFFFVQAPAVEHP